MAETSYIIQNGRRLNLKDTTARKSIGSCDELQTEAKHCLVHAINELNRKVEGGIGEKGDPGATFTPSVDSDGNLSWSNDGGLENPETVNIKGHPGSNGVSVTHAWNGTTLTVTSASGTSSVDLKGEKGDKGDPATVTVDSSFSTTSTNPVQNKVVTNKFNSLARRISQVSYNTSTAPIRYFEIGRMMDYTSGDNRGSILFIGRLGHWVSSSIANFYILLSNRGGVRASILAQGNVSGALNCCDIEVYRQDDNSDIIYLKTQSYWVFDLEYVAFQHTVNYISTSVTPTGTKVWSLSEAPKVSTDFDGVMTAEDFSDGDETFSGLVDRVKALEDVGNGDMLASVYDPQGKAQDVFAYAANPANLSAAVPIGKGGTGASDAATALANLGAVPTTRTINGKALSENIELAASDVGAIATPVNVNGTDLNELKTPGFYFGTTFINGAVNEQSVIEVVAFNNDWFVQRQTDTWNGKTWVRTFYLGTTWTSWQQVYTSANKPTAADVGAPTVSEMNTAINEAVSGLGGGGGLSMELLWENASPTSAFAAQTVTLDLSGYDMVEVITRFEPVNELYFSTFAPKNIKMRNLHAFSSAYMHGRPFTATDTGIEFLIGVEHALANKTIEENGIYGIPYQIYGIKGVTA